MATIGTFTAQNDGFTGSIKTLTLNVKQAVLRLNDKSDDKAPDYRIFAVRHTLEPTQNEHVTVEIRHVEDDLLHQHLLGLASGV